jgi:FkbM family methyltransferase
VFAKSIVPGATAWDVGANAGYYTVMLSRAVGPSGRVVSFEPFPENLRNLTDHVTWNAGHNTTVVASAVGEQAGLASFQRGASNSMGKVGSGPSSLMVPVITIDQCIHEFGLPSPTFVKMDIEGAEGSALRGAKVLLKNQRSTWFISLHGERAARETEQVLRDSGYHLFHLDGRIISERLTKEDDEIVATTAAGFGKWSS